MLPEKFNPEKPTCPRCGHELRPDQIKSSTRKETLKGTLNMYLCSCGQVMGVVVMDDHNPGEPYTVKKV